MDLATFLQVVSGFSSIIIAAFTVRLWQVSEKQAKIAKEQAEIAKKQAEIADRQTQMQETLARSETEPLIFLELNREIFLLSSSAVALSIVNMGRYGCLVLEVAVMPPNWDPTQFEDKEDEEATELEDSEREILVENVVPVLAGERKQAKWISFVQIAGRRSEWWNEFVRKQEFFIEVSYYYGGRPEEIRHDFFRVAFSARGEEIKIKTIEIAHRSSYQP